MKYAHRFTVNASLDAVVAFHQQASTMGAITPPPIFVQMHAAPCTLRDGDEMAFTLWFLAVPIPWRARIERISNHGFWDRQVEGPFDAWLHKHHFAALSATKTEVLDEIEVRLGSGLWRRLASLGMWTTLPILFAYRAWKTRRLLTASPSRKT